MRNDGREKAPAIEKAVDVERTKGYQGGEVNPLPPRNIAPIVSQNTGKEKPSAGAGGTT